MAETPAPPELSVLEKLTEAIERGRKIASRDDVGPGTVRMWTGPVHNLLRKTFGEASPVATNFPTYADVPPKDSAREALVERVDRLQHLVDTVSAAAGRATSAGANRIFIGHGRSAVWRELKDFLSDTLHLPWDEFNRESVAGIATTARLTQMLDTATFAFLVMTAEDEHADAKLHARENVVHEVGLFQGRLGMHRAIVLREEGCEVFSNIHGLSYIGFPKGYISSTFEEIRRVLIREKIISPSALRGRR